MNLFIKEMVKLSSGKMSDFKIECDALTNKDWECLAYEISKILKFRSVLGVPTGGDKLAGYLSSYAIDNTPYPYPVLICDDVLTTGDSMEKMREQLFEGGHLGGYSSVIGVVIFARRRCDNWITPLFTMTH